VTGTGGPQPLFQRDQHGQFNGMSLWIHMGGNDLDVRKSIFVINWN
jgi:hypothetical protein